MGIQSTRIIKRRTATNRLQEVARYRRSVYGVVEFEGLANNENAFEMLYSHRREL